MVGLRLKALFFVLLVVMAISIANAAKDLKEQDVGVQRNLHEDDKGDKKDDKGDKKDAKGEKGDKKDDKKEDKEESVGSKVAKKVKGAAASVASAASNASAASAASAASVASAASGKIKGAVAPIGDKLGLKGPSGPSIDVKASGAKGDGKTDDTAVRIPNLFTLYKFFFPLIIMAFT